MNKGKTLKNICVSAIFTALIAALAQIAIPTPVVYITLQTLAVALTAFLLGPVRAAAATLCYVILGAIGLPVFAGFAGGAGVLLGPTGGFLFAFPLFAVGLSFAFYVNRTAVKILLCLSSLLLLYAAGITQYAIVTGNTVKVAITAFILYFAKDLPVVLGAYFLCVRIRPTLSRFIHLK